MTLNELRYIVAVAQELNFRRAAEKAFISQPALSLAIQKLELELGVSIFERGKGEVYLTPVGHKIVEQAQRVLEEAEQIRTIAGLGQDQLTGPLRLGIIYSVGPYLLPELVPALKAITPTIQLVVEENLTVNLDTLLRNGKLDAAIIALPFGAPSILTRTLYDEPFEVVVNNAHHWAGRRNIDASELSGEKVLLLDSGHCFSNQVAEACPELNRQGRKDSKARHWKPCATWSPRVWVSPCCQPQPTVRVIAARCCKSSRSANLLPHGASRWHGARALPDRRR